LRTILDGIQCFVLNTGLFSYTLFNITAIARVVLEATIIEKRFTLCCADGGVDLLFPMESAEMAQLVAELAWQALKKVRYCPMLPETNLSSTVDC
jgi:sialic acid synthase SpsE